MEVIMETNKGQEVFRDTQQAPQGQPLSGKLLRIPGSYLQVWKPALQVVPSALRLTREETSL